MHSPHARFALLVFTANSFAAKTIIFFPSSVNRSGKGGARTKWPKLKPSLLIVDVLVHLRGRHIVAQMIHDPKRADGDDEDERKRGQENEELPAAAGL